MFSSKKKPEAISNNTHKPVTDYMIKAGINGKFKKSIIDLVEKLNELDLQQEKICADYAKLLNSYEPNAANLTQLIINIIKNLDALAEFRENPGSTDRAVVFNECSKHIESIRKIYNEIQTMKVLVENEYKELSRLAGLLSMQSKDLNENEVKINEIAERLKKKVTIGKGTLIIEDKKTKKESLCDFENEIDFDLTKQLEVIVLKKKLDEESAKAVTIAYLSAFLPSAKLLYQDYIASYQKLSNHQLQIIDKEVAEAEEEAKEMFEQFELLKSVFQPQPEAPKNNYANQQKVFGSTNATKPLSNSAEAAGNSRSFGMGSAASS